MRKLFILTLILTNLLTSYAQSDFIKDSLDAYIERGMKLWQVPGVAVGIIKDGKIIYAKGFGQRELGKPELVDANTLFMIGSNSKAFTATSLSILESEKKLSLDDKVTKWIPYFKLQDELAGKDARIRDLLCHRMGMETFQGDFTYWESSLSRKQVIETFGKINSTYPFRTKYGYCNAGFVTAGEIIPAASGQSWEDFVRQRIFKPLEMNAVALTKEMDTANNKASAHSIYDQKLAKIPYCYIDNLAAAGSISASVNDMLKWLQMELDTGKVAGVQVFPKDAIMRTWEPQINVALAKSNPLIKRQFYNYALGWFVADHNGKRVISHEGGVNGFLSNTTFIPELNAGFVVLTNEDNNGLYTAIRNQIRGYLVKTDYYDWLPFYDKLYDDIAKQKKKYDNFEINKILNNPLPANPLETYAGTYSNSVYGKLEVKIVNNTLVLDSPIHPKLSKSIKSQGGDSFWCIFTNHAFGHSVINFTVQDKKVKMMTMKVEDNIEMQPYIFTKIK
jgi:CubicO group peptidase (beta-lactamase class C family)